MSRVPHLPPAGSAGPAGLAAVVALLLAGVLGALLGTGPVPGAAAADDTGTASATATATETPPAPATDGTSPGGDPTGDTDSSEQPTGGPTGDPVPTTDPEPTDPEPTDPEPTDPEPTDPTTGPAPLPPCQQPQTPRRVRTVLVLGDSLTWRGCDDLQALHPGWVVDGERGRVVDALLPRLRSYLALSAPRRLDAVVVALGTNTTRTWTERDYRRAADLLPPRVPVVLVTPYRDPSGATSVRMLANAMRTGLYADWMRAVADEAPGRRCLAGWRGLVERRPGLLEDGVHQTRRGEGVWARLLSAAVARCAAEPR